MGISISDPYIAGSQERLIIYVPKVTLDQATRTKTETAWDLTGATVTIKLYLDGVALTPLVCTPYADQVSAATKGKAYYDLAGTEITSAGQLRMYVSVAHGGATQESYEERTVTVLEH